MDKSTSQFDPQSVDEQITRMRQQAGSSTPGASLIDDLYDLHSEDLQIRDRVWAQLNHRVAVAREQQAGSSTRQKENVSHIAQYQEIIVTRKESKIMEENTNSWGMHPLAPRGTSKKRRSPVQRWVGIGLIAAVALITIVSFTVFSGLLRSAPQTANNPTTSVGAQNQQQQQKAITSSKQVCSLNAGSKVSINGAPWSADVNWSAQGQLVVGTYSSFKAYSAKNCSPIASFQSAISQAVAFGWSPDGRKLLVTDPRDPNTYYVLDHNGKILTKLKNGGRWSSDSTKMIFTQNDSQGDSQDRPAVYSDSQLQKFRISIKAIDVNNGKVTTLTQLPEGYGAPEWSSDMKTVVVRRLKNDSNTMDLATWNTNTGQLVSNATLPEPALGQELSPDGSMLALDGEDKIEIYSTDTWKLLTSFQDKKPLGASLAWSPNGNYLAEASQSIKIYDVTAKKLATTFGQIDAQHAITDLTWSPDGTGLATSTMVLSNDQPSDLTVNVWALS